jgi:two-component system response regulator HydG
MENLPFQGKVLVVDDEINARRVLQVILERERYEICQAFDFDSAVEQLRVEDPDVVITDMKMPGKGGLEVFEFVKQHHPEIPVIFLTAFGSVEAAVEAMTRGAFYYFIKPPNYSILKGILARAVEQRQLKRELETLRRRLEETEIVPQLIGNNVALRRITELIDAVKDSDSSVLVTGETGTGKEVISRRIHYTGNRQKKPFVAVNCAAIPSSLLESELFGYEKGAFTGAEKRRIGKIEEADGGTLFLDEIGEIGPGVGAKLLRVLQEKEVERLGGNKRVKVDFRLISSTNRDLQAEVAAGSFREDLYYRLNVVQIKVPPLRERRDDIPLMVMTFLRQTCAKEGKPLEIDAGAIKALSRYSWPGNIRQLKNVIEQTVVLTSGRVIRAADLPEQIVSGEALSSMRPAGETTMKALQESAVREALVQARGNKSRAAQALGISRKALYKKLKDGGIPT